MPDPQPKRSISIEQLRDRNKNAPPELIDGMIAERSVTLLAGDSSIGKSPLLIQQGICIAAGIPFLGLATRPEPCKVLAVDFENNDLGLEQCATKIACEALGLPDVPPTWRLLQDVDYNQFKEEAKAWQPHFITVDALRGLGKPIEGKNEQAGEFLSDLRRLSRETGSAIEVLHHLKKPDEEVAKRLLADTATCDWMLQVSGARALVNQSDIRIGVEATTLKNSKAELVVRWNYKLRGEYSPIYVERIRVDGEAVGYRRLRGKGLLIPAHKMIFDKLPTLFKNKDAEDLCKYPRETSLFLGACRSAEVLERTGQKPNIIYRKRTLDVDGCPID